ncbi:MAG: hypothetical protein JNK21_06420 [Rhodospirillaceae bacterium]|nr:hypothetical protein [Rhodospirillaceae bacterium]
MLAPAVAVLGIGLSLVLWQALERGQARNLQALLHLRLYAYTKLVDTRMEGVQSSLSRMGNRWAVLQRTPRLAWGTDAKAILTDHPQLEEIQWVDAGLVRRWSVSRDAEAWDMNQPYDRQALVAAGFDIATLPHSRAPRVLNLAADASGVYYADILVAL